MPTHVAQPRAEPRARERSFSPSLHHRELAERTRPALAWNGGEVGPWQELLRAKLRELLGWPEEERAPLEPEILWRREHPLGTIEKIAFTCEPGSDALAYLCLPRRTAPPYPLFICLQGHTSGAHGSIGVERDDDTKPLVVAEDYDFGLGCLRRGIAALCLEQRSFGARREQHQKSVATSGCQDAAMQALLLGRTLVGERTFDVDRALDFLATREEIDGSRIGVMGNSGGGTVGLYAAALLPRLAFAMPSCCFCTFRDSIMAMRHCVDNYVPGILRQAEMSDVLGLFAPRPIVVVAGEKDAIFPIAATRSAFERLREIYAASGAEENCRLVVGTEGHRFYAEPAWASMLPMLGLPARQP